MSSCSNSDTESQLCATNCISISSGEGMGHGFPAPRSAIFDSVVCLRSLKWIGSDSLAGHLVSLRRLAAPCFIALYGLAFGPFWIAMFEVVIAPEV